MFWNCGDCEPKSADERQAINLTIASGAVADSAPLGRSDKSAPADSEAIMTNNLEETPLQRYKRLRYQNQVVMGSPQRRVGSPEKRAVKRG